MRNPFVTASLTCLLLLAVVSGCVELCGQRISWFHDAAKDELRILLHYDGIHESDDGQPGTGAEQIPKFVEDNNVMLLDWIGNLDLAEKREKLARGAGAPDTELELDWARLLTSIRPEPIGYYREPDGRIGAAQLVVIPKVSSFIEKLNELINRAVRESAETSAQDDPLRRTKDRIREAANQGHRWVELDGHAIRVTIPVHPGEWARQKAKGLDQLAREVAEALGGDEQKQRDFQHGLQALTAMPISYVDQGDSVTIVLGASGRPSTFRATLRDEYEPSLEKVVVETVKTDLDAELSAALLDDDAKPSAGVGAVLEFGPAEEQVRALLSAAGQDDAAKKQAALEKLRQWAEAFNRDHGVPEPPAMSDDVNAALDAWRTWYAQMKRFPLPADDGP